MNSGPIDTATPVEHALATVEVAVAELITALREGGLDHHDQAGLLALLDRAEVVRNQWQAVDAELLATCRDRKIAERECQRSMAKVLERRCLVTPGEARARMRAAEAAGPRETPTGLPLPRLRGDVSSAMGVGAITSQQVAQVNQTLDQLDRADLHPDQVKEVEAELVQHCRQFAPKELKNLCQRYLDALDPDGPEPDEQRNWDRRFFRMRSLLSGAVEGEFRLTPEVGVKLQAILSSLSSPRVDNAVGMAGADLRSHEQRLHDALGDVCARLLRAGGLPDSGGTPATVIVTIDQTDLLADLARADAFHQSEGGREDTARSSREGAGSGHDGDEGVGERESVGEGQSGLRSLSLSKGRPDDLGPSAGSGSETPHPDCILDTTHPDTVFATCPVQRPDHGHPPGRVRQRRPRRGITSDGTSLTVPELLKLAGEAEIYPIVLTQHGKLLDLGRSRRIANKHQTLALIARDGGCSFPGCDHPPEWCERHHVVPWIYDGPTDLKNLTLLCSYHHHHFLNRGWEVRINDDGLPEWIPPRYLDREQKPMINNRIIARIHSLR